MFATSAAPSFPFPGLVNSLSSDPTSPLVSILTSTTHTISDPPSLPCPLKVPDPSISHTASCGNRFAFTHNNTLYFQIPSNLPIPHPSRLPFESLSLSLSVTSDAHLLAVASQNGVHITSLPLHPPFTFSPLCPLPSTQGHSCVAVSINPNAYIAVASLAGQIAIYLNAHSPAAYIIPLPDSLHLVDRITQVSFTSSTLLVAWWSGTLFAYTPTATLLWRHSLAPPKTPAPTPSPSFTSRAGTFFALNHSQNCAVFITGNDSILFGDISTPRWVRKKLISHNTEEPPVISGVCVCKSGIYLWVRGASQLMRTDWPQYLLLPPEKSRDEPE